MIITDTAAVNTGKHTGAVTRLQKEIQPTPIFYPCQLHVLDRALKIFVENNYKGHKKSTSPEIDLDCVVYIKANFDNLVDRYQKHISQDEPEFYANGNYQRNDYNYLFLLWKAHLSNIEYPNICFKIPPTSEARWNSRASFFYMTWFLVSEKRDIICNVLEFLNSIWKVSF